jgi:hypothetical protein
LQQAEYMAEACQADEVKNNPGVLLGLIMGVAALQGLDKLTIISSPDIVAMGAWLEQLIAESSGKLGKSIIPIDLEPLSDLSDYAEDRLTIYLSYSSALDKTQEKFIQQLHATNRPYIKIQIADQYALAQEFFRWEIATAVACAVLEVNAFDQPDVEASKIVTKELTTAYEKTGQLPTETALIEDEYIALYTDSENEKVLQQQVAKPNIAAYLQAHLSRIKENDYFALLAYIEMSLANQEILQDIRNKVKIHYKVATCLGFGPRFLHSTGQAYKGGKNNGVFLQLTYDNAEDLPVPNQEYSFSIVKNAQAIGDFAVLAKRQRRVLRIHIKKELALGLKTIQKHLTL